MALIDELLKKNPGYNAPELIEWYAKSTGASAEEISRVVGYSPPGIVGDTLRSLKQGVEQIPGTVAGLVDIPFAAVGLGRPATKAADWAAEKTGFAPGKWAQESQRMEMSPEYYRQQQEVQDYWNNRDAGVLDGVGVYAKNLRVTGMNIAQSLPQLAVGGAVGRGAAVGARALGLGVREEALAAGAMGPGRASTAGWVAPTAAGIGEGSLSAGAQMQQYDPNLPDQQRNALTSLGVGAGVGLVGAVGGAAARRLGVEDIQIRMAGGQPVDLMADLAKRPLSATGRIAGGGAAEGLLQEAPQSAIEAVGQNYANNRPLAEGMNRQVVEGALAGAAIGGVFNIRTNRSRGQWQRDVDAAQATATNPELPPSQRMAALDFLQQVRENDIPVAQAAEWRQQAGGQLDQQLEARRAEIQQELDAQQRRQDLSTGVPVSLLGGTTAAPAVAPDRAAALLSTPPVAGDPNAPAAVVPDTSGVVGTDPVPAAGEGAQAPAVGVADVAAAPVAVAPQLTPSLRKSKPRYGGSTLEFPDDVHKAAYIIGKDGTKSARDAEYLSFVKKALGVDARTARAYGRQIVAALKGAAAVDGKITVPSVPFNQGVQNGNDSQSVRPGQPNVGQTQAVPGDQGANVGSGTQAAQGAGVQAGESEVTARVASDMGLPATAVPKRKKAAAIPGRSTSMDDDGIQFVADALTQDGNTPSGPYARLFTALKQWDRSHAAALGAKGAGKRAEHFARAMESTRGAAGSVDAVVPLLYAMEQEFGTKNMDRIIGAIKSADEEAGITEISPHVRLAAAWNAYKTGTLTGTDGITSGMDAETRNNFLEEAIDREVIAAGGEVQPALAERMQDRDPGKPLKSAAKSDGGKGVQAGQSVWSGKGSGVMNYLQASTWQGFSSDVKAVAVAVYEHFRRHGGVPSVVISREEGKSPSGARVFGSYDTATNTVTLYKGGHSPRIFLHEMLHAATAQFIENHPKSAAVEQLDSTLIALKKNHAAEFARFQQEYSLDAGTLTRLNVAFANTIDQHPGNRRNEEQRLTALQEFVTYGLMDPDFQAYMKFRKLEATLPFEMKQQGIQSGPQAGTVRKNAASTIWSKFVDTLSWIVTGKAYSRTGATAMDKFLSDMGGLFEAMNPPTTPTKKAAPVAEKPAPAAKPAPPTKPTVAAAKPATAAPAPVDKGPEILMQGDRVKLRTKDGTVVRVLNGGGYRVHLDESKMPLSAEFATRENLTFVSREGKTLKAEAPRDSTESIVAGAEAIARMPEEVRDNTELPDFPGGAQAYELWEARKMQPKPSEKLKRVTDSNSFSLWQSYDYIANVDGQLYGVSKEEDPDEPDDESKFIFSYYPLLSPRDGVNTTTSDSAELLAEIRGKAGGKTLYAQAPAFPNAGQGVNTNTLPFDEKWVRKPGWLKPIFSAMGYTKLANASGEKLTAMAEAFAKAFPGAAKWVAYVDWAFGLPEALKTAWSNAGAQSHYPNLTANELAESMKHLPLDKQEAVLSYLDGNSTVIDPQTKQLADDFMNAFDELIDEYLLHVDLPQHKKELLKGKIDAAKLSDLLIYISDPSKTTGHRMSTTPIAKYLEAITGAAQDTEVKGLDGGANSRFFVRTEQVKGANGVPVTVIAGFVREDLVNTFTLPPGETLDQSVGWFHKGTDPVTKEILFTRNMGFADAKALNAASSHAAAIQNTVEQMNRVVTSARYAEATINLGRTAGLVYDSKDALVKDHPRMADVLLTPIGRAVNESYELKAKLRRTDQWIEVPADSGSYGAMAGKIINGSVWAALDDIHHKQPVIDSPAYNNIIRWFKKNKTVWSPGTHMVNVGSNVAWMYLHDIPVSSVADGTKLYYKAKAAPGSMTPKERALWTAFQKSGALIADYSSTELRKVLADASLAALGEKPSSLWGMTQAMTLYEKVKASRMVAYASKADDFAQNMYAAEDNVFRLAAFMSAAATLENEQGSRLTDDQLLEAGRAAATEFLDYSIHARGVNLLKQTVVPFISWPYRALPALLKIAVYKPWKLGGLIGAYALLDSLAAAMSGGDDEDKRKRKALPAYMNQRMFGFGPHMYLEVPGLGTAEKPVYFKLGGFIPLGDLVQDDNRNGFMGQKWFPSQITPNGPLVSTLVGAIGGVDPFTGQKINRDTDSQWDAFKKRAMFLEGQMAPPALDARKVGEKWDRVVNDKTGPLGNEYSKSLEIAQWVGLRVIQTDLAEAADLQRRAVGAITMEYKKELRVTREAKRFPNRDPQDLVETRAAIRERMKEEIDRVRNTGEE